jgi:hypothetical protein
MAFACFKCFAPKEIGLPSAAYKMAGVWQNTTTENYGVWLREYLALPMAKALIAERLVQNPTFEVREGGKKLHCTTNCRMAIPVEEDLIEGESTLEEPNLSMTYAVQGFWEVGASIKRDGRDWRAAHCCRLSRFARRCEPHGALVKSLAQYSYVNTSPRSLCLSAAIAG